MAQGIDTSSTDTKGTVLIKNASELENYSKGEENKLEEYIKSIADTGVKVLLSGGAIGEMAMHFIEKYNIMAVSTGSAAPPRRCIHASLPLAVMYLLSTMERARGGGGGGAGLQGRDSMRSVCGRSTPARG